MSLQEVFRDELLQIENMAIRRFVLACEPLFYKHFWAGPASTSGRYHPKNTSIIVHTKLAIIWGLELYRAWPKPYAEMRNEMIGALILHDAHKPIVVHAEHMAAATLKFFSHHTPLSLRIIEAIKRHNGIWAKDKPEDLEESKIKQLCLLVHWADYCASRRIK